MRICLYEDRGCFSLSPLSLTRPTFALRCGAFSLLDRLQQTFQPGETGALVRPYLADLCRLQFPQLHVNDLHWLAEAPIVLVNARWLPNPETRIDTSTPHVGVIGEQVVYIVPRSGEMYDVWPADVDDHHLSYWRLGLPVVHVGGRIIDYPWDLVECNAEMLQVDIAKRPIEKDRSPSFTIVGPRNRLFVDPSARIDPFVVFDTTRGPIHVSKDVVVESFSRLEGPCWIGAGSTLMNAKIRGSTIGPRCKVGGDVESSIIHGHSNKAHDGFLGHSYIGEWVNLGAGTQFSDLRNDYGPVRVLLNGERINTGLLKVGSFLGDFTRTGLNTLFNTGSIVGAFCSLPSIGGYLPRVIPSFCSLDRDRLCEESDLEGLFAVATAMMSRRGISWTTTHRDFFRFLHDWTSLQRDEVLRELQVRKLRKSV